MSCARKQANCLLKCLFLGQTAKGNGASQIHFKCSQNKRAAQFFLSQVVSTQGSAKGANRVKSISHLACQSVCLHENISAWMKGYRFLIHTTALMWMGCGPTKDCPTGPQSKCINHTCGILCVCVRAHVHLCLTLCNPMDCSPLDQAPLSTGFSRQEYWNGLLFPSPGDLPDPGSNKCNKCLHLIYSS